MSIILYTSWISTFARKVAIGLELKGLAYESIDGLRRDFRTQLTALNPRAEVPVLKDGDVTVVNSSDILQYLEWRYPSPALYPAEISERVVARALERLADQRFDSIVVDSSIWKWAQRNDEPPQGLLKIAQDDIDECLTRLESALSTRSKPWPFGAPGIVECAWFPNLIALRPQGFALEADRFPAVVAWLATMREHPVFTVDRKRTADFIKTLSNRDHERQRIFWSGDRIEWLMSRGFHRWFKAEIETGRTTFPET
ncbi:MAG TPA: glutathione S-transferase family protein [Steroidobacteraceae bacterium]|nr:glutathione S-transferase family protein [Steroidobacteraceae bacterium]